MPVSRSLRFILVIAPLALGACRTAFVPTRFQSNTALYEASLRELNARHWGNAVAGFERLTIELPARDTLFPLALWHLGRAHQGRREWLLAAQSFTRLAETFSADTLADEALVEAGMSYGRMWRKPSLDSEYGETAMATLETMLTLFPNSPHVPRAQREVDRLREWFGRKDLVNAMHYFRRKAYDSAIIYFNDVIQEYPTTAAARAAMLRLAESYRKINYREELAETCSTLRERYPADGEVREQCGTVPRTANSADTTRTDTARTTP
ncbi:MAG: outer membrane protein assembly factor BamD [Gemmatimonadota bacterium]|nr:outer membrane protein assembly factor BamD [Gemmatimonadota bacterium]